MANFASEYFSKAGLSSGDMVAKSARTTSGASSWIDVGRAEKLVAQLDSNAGTGTTPNLAVKFQTSPDGQDATAVDVTGGAFTAVTTSLSMQIKEITPIHQFVKVVWTITGTTPSFTFGVYATGR